MDAADVWGQRVRVQISRSYLSRVIIHLVWRPAALFVGCAMLGEGSDACEGGDLGCGDGVREAPVIALVLVRVGGREADDRLVEARALPQVGRDRKPIARPRVGARQRPAARPGVGVEPRFGDSREIDRRLPVPELADVEIVLVAVEALASLPAEEDVGRRVGDSLAANDPFRVVGILARSQMGSRTEAWASFACSTRGSLPPRPTKRKIEARVPTLPTPTTLRAASTNR